MTLGRQRDSQSRCTLQISAPRFVYVRKFTKLKFLLFVIRVVLPLFLGVLRLEAQQKLKNRGLGHPASRLFSASKLPFWTAQIQD